MGKAYEDLTIRDDFMFGIIMRKKKFCIPFLEMVLKVKIKDIQYTDSQKTFDAEMDARAIRLDVFVDDGKGSVYDIEMQNANRKDLAKRFRYYQSVLDTDMLNRGCLIEELKTSFIIFICTFDPFKSELPVYTFRQQAEESPDVILDDGTTRIVLNTTAFEKCEDPQLKAFLGYVETGTSIGDFTKGIENAIKESKHKNEGRGKYMTLQMKYEEIEHDAREKGLAEGRAEGISQGQYLTLYSLFSKGKLTLKEAVEEAGIDSEADFLQGMAEAGYDISKHF